MIKNVIKHLFIILINAYNKIVLVMRKNLIKLQQKRPTIIRIVGLFNVFHKIKDSSIFQFSHNNVICSNYKIFIVV